MTKFFTVCKLHEFLTIFPLKFLLSSILLAMMFIFKVLILVFISSSPLYAQDFAAALEEQMDILQNINYKTARDFNSGACFRRYDKLLKDNTLNILIGFGYTDSVPHDLVYDWYMVNGLVRALTGPCRQGISACEFKRSKDPYKFIRDIEGLDGRLHRVEVTLIRGSISGSHKDNMSPKNIARQQATCELATNKFFEEMMKGPEVVYYSGHSRNGGGPDFCPPKVLGNGHVDYDWYERMNPGMNRMLDALARSTKDTHVLAMHSCSSISHFYRKVSAIKPQMAFLGSRFLLNMKSDFQNQYGSLDAILNLRCQSGLKASMGQGVGIELVNMFGK